MRRVLCAVCAMGISAVAAASERYAGLNYLDGYYVADAEIKVSSFFGSGKDDGDGFGVKLGTQLAEGFFFNGEWQSIETDQANIELDQLRLGLGFAAPVTEMLVFTPRIEMLRGKFSAPGQASNSETGVGFHAGALLNLTPQFIVTGGVGYITELDDFSGPEFHIGGRLLLSPEFSLFLDYRATRLSDSGEDLDISDLRIGAGFHF